MSKLDDAKMPSLKDKILAAEVKEEKPKKKRGSGRASLSDKGKAKKHGKK